MVGRHTGGITDPTYFFKSTVRQNFYYGESAVSGETEKSAWPVTSGANYSLVLAPKAGGMSSRGNTDIDLSSSGYAVLGLPASGSATITISADGTGGLIVSGSGSATISIDASGTLLSIASASGSATITLSTSAAIGALAGMSGSATITMDASAVSYAIGYLSGTSSNESEFSPDALARAVWDAVVSDFNTAGTMGEVMNNIGAGANPWSALLADNVDPDTFGEFVQKLLTTAKFLGLK